MKKMYFLLILIVCTSLIAKAIPAVSISGTNLVDPEKDFQYSATISDITAGITQIQCTWFFEGTRPPPLAPIHQHNNRPKCNRLKRILGKYAFFNNKKGNSSCELQV